MPGLGAISCGQAELKTISASVAGGLIAFYEIGYGIAAFGVGPLQALAALSLDKIFGASSVIALALALAVLALLIVRRPRGIIPAAPGAQTCQSDHQPSPLTENRHEPESKLAR